jgi:hypothetical protein
MTDDLGDSDISAAKSTGRIEGPVGGAGCNGRRFPATSSSVSEDPATTGEVSLDRLSSEPTGASTARSSRNDDSNRRVLGFGAADIGAATWLPDESEALTQTVESNGRSFHGAFVPLVIHDPLLAERSFDAAEWAADLIRLGGGTCLCITPFAERGSTLDVPLSHRQWNHTAAMIERLDELCGRFKLKPVTSDRVGGRQVRDGEGLDPERPIHYVLDAGNFLPDGFVPTRLVSPERSG